MTPDQALDDSTRQNRWLILALLFACRTGLGLQFQALGSVSGSLTAQLGFSNTEIGTLIGFFILPGLLLALPAGYLGRYLSDRTLVAVAFLCLGAGGAIAAAAHGFGLLAWGRIAAGVGFVFSTIYLTKMTADWFSGKELATAMGILVMSWPFGIAMGQIGQVWIDVHFGWRAAFAVSAGYCTLGAVAMFVLYRAPAVARPLPVGKAALPRPELVLTLLAAIVWGLFNAGYIVYLSFATQVLVAGGYGPTQAAAVISLASWVMIFSGAACGQIADRTGRRELIMYVCTAVAVASLLLLTHTSMAIVLSLLFGLIGMAPAGVIMALTAEAMAPQRRAFGMGVFFTLYFVVVMLAPPIAGWLFDRSADPYVPIVFAAVLFAGGAFAYRAFSVVKARIARA
jgi:predicted MFS family arabinose efflux permease